LAKPEGWVFQINHVNEWNMRIKLDGDGAHFEAFIGVNRIANKDDSDYKYNDTHVGYFYANCTDPIFKMTSKMYITIQPYFKIIQKIDNLRRSFFIDYFTDDQLFKISKLIMGRPNRGQAIYRQYWYF
jgi:hypothetical protein